MILLAVSGTALQGASDLEFGIERMCFGAQLTCALCQQLPTDQPPARPFVSWLWKQNSGVMQGAEQESLVGCDKDRR